MKKIILITLLALAPSLCSAQAVSFDSFYNKYSGHDGYTTMELTGALMKMLSREMGDGFDGVNVMKLAIGDGAGFIKDARAIVEPDFAKLFDVNTGDDNFQIWHKAKGKGSGKGKSKTEYILLAGSGEQLTVIYLEGEIDLSDLKNFSILGLGKQ